MTDPVRNCSAGSEGATQEYVLRAMSKNYTPGNRWDDIDIDVCSKAADEIKALRAGDSYRTAWLELIDLCNRLKEENFQLRHPLRTGDAAQPAREPAAWTKQSVENYFEDWPWFDTLEQSVKDEVVDDVTRMVRTGDASTEARVASQPSPAATVDPIHDSRNPNHGRIGGLRDPAHEYCSAGKATGAGSTIPELLVRAEKYLAINAADGRGSGLLVMELADALRAITSTEPQTVSMREALSEAHRALVAFKDAVIASDKMKGREYVGLGIQVSDAIDKARLALSSEAPR